MSQSHLDIDVASVFEPGEKPVRVFSDGVPERDCPRGCQLAVPCTRKVIGRDPKKQGQTLLGHRRSSGKQSRGNGLSCCQRLLTAVRLWASLCRSQFEPAPTTGSVPHHHIFGNCRWRGQTSFSVSASYKRPFFITYRIVFVLWMSSSGLASSTIKSASLPGSIEPKSCSMPIACAPLLVATRSTSCGFIPPAAIAHSSQWSPRPSIWPCPPRPM